MDRIHIIQADEKRPSVPRLRAEALQHAGMNCSYGKISPACRSLSAGRGIFDQPEDTIFVANCQMQNG